MSTKKKISDIDKAIEEMQQRRDECFKHIGKVMYESCPELGDMSVTDMRKAGRYMHKHLSEKSPSQGAPFRMGCFAESSVEAGWEQGASGGSKGAVKTAPSRAGRVTTKRRNFLFVEKSEVL